MMMFRSILFVIWMYGLMAVLGLLALPALLLPKSVTFWAISLYARGLIWGLKVFCGISVEIRGRQNMPRGTVLYAGKHNCMLDVFIPCDACTGDHPEAGIAVVSVPWLVCAEGGDDPD